MSYYQNFASNAQAPGHGRRQPDAAVPTSPYGSSFAYHANIRSSNSASVGYATQDTAGPSDGQQARRHQSSGDSDSAAQTVKESWWSCCVCKTPYAIDRFPACVTRGEGCYGHTPCKSCKKWSQTIDTKV
ncbi:hypothetical protein TWF696_001773 [Orbilia brochopaga]|uniref:Uncharacterized protein n=1 Tax=Orbilia brochopaga TaxID=3140254 RepID=A0AAV9U622_9PEZI